MGKLKNFFKKPAVQILVGNPIGAIKAQKDKKKAAQKAAESTVAAGVAAQKAAESTVADSDTGGENVLAGSMGDAPPPSSPSDKILGMPKMVFYGVAGLLVVGAAFFAYKKFKK